MNGREVTSWTLSGLRALAPLPTGKEILPPPFIQLLPLQPSHAVLISLLSPCLLNYTQAIDKNADALWETVHDTIWFHLTGGARSKLLRIEGRGSLKTQNAFISSASAVVTCASEGSYRSRSSPYIPKWAVSLWTPSFLLMSSNLLIWQSSTAVWKSRCLSRCLGLYNLRKKKIADMPSHVAESELHNAWANQMWPGCVSKRRLLYINEQILHIETLHYAWRGIWIVHENDPESRC